MQQKFFSPKTGMERPAAPAPPIVSDAYQPQFDGQPEAPKKQRRERADSIVQRIIAEVKKMAGPSPSAPEAKAADADKRKSRAAGHDILNKNKKSAEERADSLSE